MKIILSFGFMQKQKISVMNFARRAAMEPLKQAFCEQYGFVPPRSVGALVTLHHVGTVVLVSVWSHFQLDALG